jgi:hypothetical protein|tara:strand:+ start:3798 stop:4001 length:204 start_codon:yes stop_codon:yes gene_type:complete
LSIIVEKVKVVELTLEDGSKILCRGGEESVRKSWDLWPVVSARWTGEEETMQWYSDINETPDGFWHM